MVSDEEMTDAKVEIGATTKAVKLQLQQFWVDKPQNWFNVAELQFQLAGIKSDKTKFAQALSALSPNACDIVSDILTCPPEHGRYEALKNALLSRLTPSDEANLESLLSGQDMGDRRPTEMLRQIRHLAGSQFPEHTVKSLWIRKMPEIIKIALVAQPDGRLLDDLAATADKLHEAMSSSKTISAVTRQSRPTHRTMQPIGDVRIQAGGTRNSSSIEQRLATLEARLDSLTQRMNDRNRSQDRRGRSRPRRSWSRSNSRSRNQSRENNANYNRNWCRFHNKFGNRAYNCNNPCSYAKDQANNHSNNSEVEMETNKHKKNM